MKGDIHGAGQVNCYITPSLTCHGGLSCIILVVLSYASLLVFDIESF